MALKLTLLYNAIPDHTCVVGGDSRERPKLPVWHLCLLGLTLSLSSCASVKARLKVGEANREGLVSAHHLSVKDRTFTRQRLVSEDEGEDHHSYRGLIRTVLAPFGNTAKGLFQLASKLQRHGDIKSSGAAYLKVALESREILIDATGAGTSLPDVQAVYNASLAEFAHIWAEQTAQSGGVSPVLELGNARYEVKLAANSQFPPQYFDKLYIAANIKEKGVTRKVRDGIGASLVGIRVQLPERREEMAFYPKRGLYLPVTMVVNDVVPAKDAAGTTVVTVSLLDPTRTLTTRLGKHDHPLAADFSSPIAMSLSGVNELKDGLDGFFFANQRISQAGLYLLQPYDPERIPVLLTHGLFSSSVIWRDVLAELMADPEISTRYQFMVFTYPSSYIVAESARLERAELEAIRKAFDPGGKDPLSRNMVAIGHSMGGILTHSLVSEIGDRFYKQLSDVPFDPVKLGPEETAIVREMAFFSPDQAINRAVFICTPHRGASMARASYANLCSRLVHLPIEVLERSTKILMLDPSGLNLTTGGTTSIQSLQPGTPFVTALDNSPYKKGVTYHSIIGDRGKGNTPKSSDGVVDYWSSHQEGAASELIVPAGHTAYTHPAAIAEVKRILHENVGLIHNAEHPKLP